MDRILRRYVPHCLLKDAMNENIASPTSFYHQREIKSAFENFITTETATHRPDANWCDVSLTLKQWIHDGDRFERLTRPKISNCIEELMKAVNRHVFRNASRRYGKRLVCVPVIENSKGGRLHIHMLLEIPEYMNANPDEFFQIFLTEWRKIPWSDAEYVIRRIPSHEDKIQWTKYILKDFAKDDEGLDDKNFHLGRRRH